jgi:hypothetical protein
MSPESVGCMILGGVIVIICLAELVGWWYVRWTKQS